MPHSDQRQELIELAQSLRETAARLRKAAPLIGEEQAHELLAAGRALLTSSLSGLSKNGEPTGDADQVQAKRRQKAPSPKQTPKSSAKKRSRKKPK